MSDNVKHPNHYCKAGIECIDAIKSAISTITDPFEAYCTGNIIKYIWRWNDKNGIEDLHKAIQYIDFIEQYRASKTILPLSAPNRPTQAELEDLFEGEEDVRESEIVDETWDCRACGEQCIKCPLSWRTNEERVSCNEYAEHIGIKKAAQIRNDYLEGLEKQC